MSDNVIKILPTELDGNSRYAIRVRTINSFGTVSDWSDSIIADTYDAGTATGGKLVLTANGMIAYDPNGQTSLVYSGLGTASRTNLVVNPSFEVNANGWSALPSSAISRITTDFYVGEPAYKASLKVTSSSATLKDVGFITATANRIVSASGRVYTISAYIKALVSQVSIKIGVVFYDSTGAILKTAYSYSPRLISADGLWARVSIIGTQAPNLTASIGIILSSTSAMTSGQSFLVDGILGERSSTLGDYFDGSTSLGATKWNGTPHFSTSIFDFSSPYFVDGGVFTAGTLQTAVDVGVPQDASPYYGKAGVKMSTSGVQGYSGLQATPSFSLATDGKFRVGGTSNYMYWDGATLTIAGNLAAGVIDIGGFDSTSFHVDATGQMWMGAATYATAPLKISSAGNFYAKSLNLLGSDLSTIFSLGNPSAGVYKLDFLTSYIQWRPTTTTDGLAIVLNNASIDMTYTGGGFPVDAVTVRAGDRAAFPSSDANDSYVLTAYYGTSNQATLGTYDNTGGSSYIRSTSTSSTSYLTIKSSSGIVQFDYSEYLTSASATGNWFRPYDGANMHIKATTGSMYFDTDGTWYWRSVAGTNRMQLNTSGGLTISNTHLTLADSYTSYSTAHVIAGDNSTRSSVALWVNGYASQFRMSSAAQDVYIRNYDDSAYPVVNCDVVDQSSKRYKRDIVPFRRSLSSGVESALSSLMKVEVVSYKRNKSSIIPTDKDGNFDESRQKALDRLNTIRTKRGLQPFKIEHICGIHCENDSKDPCATKFNEDKDLPGVIAEQVYEVLPEVVSTGPTKAQPEGIKTLSLLAVTIKALQEMKETVDQLQAEIAVLKK